MRETFFPLGRWLVMFRSPSSPRHQLTSQWKHISAHRLQWTAGTRGVPRLRVGVKWLVGGLRWRNPYGSRLGLVCNPYGSRLGLVCNPYGSRLGLVSRLGLI
jgi:hypothetical protein